LEQKFYLQSSTAQEHTYKLKQIIAGSDLSEVVKMAGEIQPDKEPRQVTSGIIGLPYTSYTFCRLIVGLDTKIQDSKLADEVCMALHQYTNLGEEIISGFDREHFDVSAVGSFSGVLYTSSIKELRAHSYNSFESDIAGQADKRDIKYLRTTFVELLAQLRPGWMEPGEYLSDESTYFRIGTHNLADICNGVCELTIMTTILVRCYSIGTMINAVSERCNIGIVRQHPSQFVTPSESAVSFSGLERATFDSIFRGISPQQLNAGFEDMYRDLMSKGLTRAHMQQFGPQTFSSETILEQYDRHMQDMDLKLINELHELASGVVQSGINPLLSAPNSHYSNVDMSSLILIALQRQRVKLPIIKVKPVIQANLNSAISDNKIGGVLAR
jgi:hypothetical protein